MDMLEYKECKSKSIMKVINTQIALINKKLMYDWLFQINLKYSIVKIIVSMILL